MPEYKLFRFYDFTVKSGQTYRYRVRLALEDVNHPADPMTQPRPQHLDRSVVARLKEIPVAEKPEDRIYWRRTDWSEPSEALGIARSEQVLAGTVNAPALKSIRVNDKTIYYENPAAEPEANMIVVAYDPTENGDIPGEQKLKRGAVANFKESKDVWMVDPLKGLLKKKDGYTFKSDMLVVDIMGGQKIESAKKGDKLQEPGEVLIMTPTGELIVRNEIEDSQEYFFNKFPDPEPPLGGAYGEQGGSGYSGYPPSGSTRSRGGRAKRGSDDGYGGESAQPRRRPRRRSANGY